MLKESDRCTARITGYTSDGEGVCRVDGEAVFVPGALAGEECLLRIVNVGKTCAHVAVNGQAAGPFDMATLKQMAVDGQITSDSLVWKAGMPEWVKASSLYELKGLVTPPIPTAE